MRPYLDLMQRILDDGTKQQDRTGTGTKCDLICPKVSPC
jgi:thymidylate synthase